MPAEIIIETSASPEGGYRAHVAQGADWTRGWMALSDDRRTAYLNLRDVVRSLEPHAEFIHAEA